MRSIINKSRSAVRPLIAAALLLTSCEVASAAVQLPPIFGEGMVLQRDCPLPIWGTATPGEKITVSLRSQKLETVASNDGRWSVLLLPEPADNNLVELRVAGENTITLGGILMGDVWLCAGQSNMALQLKKTRNADEEIRTATHPMIRQFLASEKSSEKPARDVAGTWQKCSPETAGEFSAVAYYLARNLQEKTGIPIGILNCSWGGTRIESWMDADIGASARPAYDRAMTRYREEKAADKFLPSGISNAMVRPLYPMAIRGVVWYQGESNVLWAEDYASLFVEMISQWRKGFRQPELPFYFVQLPGYDDKRDPSGLNWAKLREAQTKALKLPKVSMIVTMDLGEQNRLHPVASKSEIGRRLAEAILEGSDGNKRSFSGSDFREISVKENSMHIAFDPENPLSLKGDGGFEIAGHDRVFHPAKASIEGDAVVVRSEAVTKPEAVRHAWKNASEVSLFNSSGRPVGPFRSDSW